MQTATWQYLNNQLKKYNQLLKEDFELKQLESFKPIALSKYLGPKATTALDYINIWAPAYELDIQFPQTEPQTYQIRHKDGTLTTVKHHLESPTFHSKDIALLYSTLKYYETISEPITNPNMVICEKCTLPMYITEQSDIAQTSTLHETLGNSGCTITRSHQVYCSHCGAEYIFDEEEETYTSI
jgi:hypothetical protein